LGTGSVPFSLDGFIGGGQVGFNYQFARSWVIGLEADIEGLGGANESGSLAQKGTIFTQVHTGTASGTIISSASVDWLGTVRGRLGFLVTPTLLAYATGGLAYGGVQSSTRIVENWTVNGLPPPYPATSFGSTSNTLVGWTVGGGGAWKFAPHWSTDVEYLYYDLGSVSYSPSALQLVDPPQVVVVKATPRSTANFNGSIVRAGLNYHFN
jgi:outer membrane immunogenic protein